MPVLGGLSTTEGVLRTGEGEATILCVVEKRGGSGSEIEGRAGCRKLKTSAETHRKSRQEEAVNGVMIM